MRIKGLFAWVFGLCLAAATAGGALVVDQTRRAVTVEMAAARDLMLQTARLALLVPNAAALDDLSGAVARLAIRHGRMILVDAAGHERARSAPYDARVEDKTAPAPDWFAALIAVTPERIPLTLPDGGRLWVETDPSDELAEAWDDAASLSLGAVGLIALALATAARFAHLAAALRRGEAQIRALARQLVQVQDEERRALAHDIHDELGPHLFALRVDMHALSAAAAAQGEDEAADRLLTTTEAIHSLARRILSRLRPMALERGPLSEALADLAADWRRRAPEIDWRLDCAPELDQCDPSAAETLYRIVQEAMLNAARHAAPHWVRVELSRAEGPSGPRAALKVENDGFSVADRNESAPGCGVDAMIARAQALGGWAKIAPRRDGGGVVTAEIPLPSPVI